MKATTKRRLSYAAGLTFLITLGLAPNPAGAQVDDNGNAVLADGPVIPGQCPDCDRHNAQPGAGIAGIFLAQHACDVSTGQGFGLYWLGNPDTKPQPYSLKSLAPDGVTVEHTYSGTIPARAGFGNVSKLAIQVPDDSRDGKIVLAGSIGGRVKQPETFACPCAQPTPPTTATVPPSPTVPGSTVPGSPTTSVASTVTSVAPRLPATGSASETLGLIAAWLIAAGLLAWYASKKFRTDAR
jgi:LPXTG-motif cell wall-anchored protein